MSKQFLVAGLVVGLAVYGLVINNGPGGYKELSGGIMVNSAGALNTVNAEKRAVRENCTGSGNEDFTADIQPDSRERVIGMLGGEARREGEVLKVWLNGEVDENSRVWLEYDLYGVAGYSSVCKSVNEQLATGGCFVKTSDGWSHQRELISPKEVRPGLNIVRFNIDENARYSYRVKNVRLHAEAGNAGRGVVINQTETNYTGEGYAYIQGFATGEGSEQAIIRVDGQEVQSNRGVFESIIEEEGKTGDVPVSINVEAEYSDGKIISKVVNFEPAAGCDYSFPLTHRSRTTLQKCLPENTVDFRHEGLELSGSAYALKSPVTLSATTLRSQDMAPMDGGLVNVTGMGRGYRMLPHGNLFTKDMRIRIKYDSSLIPAGYTPEDIYTFYYDEAEGNWVVLERDTVDASKGEIISYTNHFTDFINGVIKAPDMPEVQAYTPTSIKDLKAADPLAGTYLMSAPTANNMGTATTGLPIEIPAGRGGMQPSLGIQYSSGGGNGWMGLGWNISVPEISVETRWGVPRYDATLETESYLMNGEELTPQVQRSNYQTRSAGSVKQFFPRVEGAFDKIERNGSSPSTYSWTVTDRNGTKYYYGNTTDSKLATAEGNIARWTLSRIEDVNGNSVIYEYETKTWSAPGTIADGGKQIYLKKITYTNTGATKNGKYWVDFVLEDPATVQRQDVQISYRTGMKEVSGHRLARVVVGSEWGEVSRYVMTYTNGTFGKTLLSDVNHYVGGSTESTVKNYHFNYFQPDGRNPYFNSKPDTISVPDANLRDGTLFGAPTAIGNNKSWEAGGEIGAGVGIGSAVWSKKNSINASYGRNQSWGKVLSSLMDINGDGLPDKVVRNGENISYYPLTLNASGVVQFSTSPIAIGSLNSIGKDRSHTNSYGVSLHAGVSKPVSVNVAGEYSRTKSITNAYFAEVNSDGLPDFIKDGEVYYNKLVNGIPVFEKNLTNIIYLGGCDTIVLSNGIDPNVFEEEPDTIFNRKTDVVRVWIAPYDGNVKVGQEIVYGTNPAANGSNPAEWVKYSIEYKNSVILLDSISTQSTAMHTMTDSIMNVHKGDKIFFRLSDNDHVSKNIVSWRCTAYYKDKDTARVDADSKHVYSFASDDDYTVSNKSLLEMPYAGQVRIKGNVIAPALSDTVRFRMMKNGNLYKEKTFTSNSAIAYSLDTNITVNSEDQFAFLLKSNSQVEWSAVSSPFKVTYLSITTTPAFTVDTMTAAGTVAFRPYVEYSLFANDMKPSVPHLMSGDARAYLYLLFDDATVSGQVTGTVKSQHQLITESSKTITAGNQQAYMSLGFINATAQTVYIDVYSSDINLTKKIRKACLIIDNDSFAAGVHTVYPDSLLIFGNLNRGWGQFAYSPESRTAPIDTALLKEANCTDDMNTAFNNLSNSSTINQFTENNIETGISDIGNLLQNNGMVNPLDEVFSYMYLDMADNQWKGVRGQCTVDRETMSTENWFDYEITNNWQDIEISDQSNPGNVYENESLSAEDLTQTIESPYPVVVPGVVIRAVNKVSKTDNYSLSASIGVTLASAGVNGTISRSNQLSDFMDMNGDGYPDVVGAEKIQYTTPYRDFEATGRDVSSADLEVVSRNNSFSNGATVGTNFSSNEHTHEGKSYKTRSKGSVGAGGVWGRSHQSRSFNDVNGDGLPDYVYKGENGTTYVKLNKGYGFETDTPVSSLDTNYKSRSECYNVNLSGGYNWLDESVAHEEWECSISFGMAFTFSNDGAKYFLADVNSDGLPDRLRVDNVNKKLYVRINMGTVFASEVQMVDFGDKYKETRSDHQEANVSGTAGFPFLGITKFIVSLSVNAGKSSTANKAQLMDVNNDGFADVVFSDKEDQIIVYYSTLGGVNLLQQVTNPSGGYFTMSYNLGGCSQNSPERSMVMSSVTVYDAHAGDGANWMNTTFEYTDAVYDRENRTSYGFETVKTKQNQIECTQNCVYRVLTEKYHTDDYRFKGLKKYEELADAAGNKYVSTTYTYVLKYINNGTEADPAGAPYCSGVYPAIKYEDQYFYEGQANYSIHTQKKYTHTSRGNVSQYEDNGDMADAGDDVKVVISYDQRQVLLDKNILSAADTVKVYSVAGSTNTLMRSRYAAYDNNGRVTSVNMKNGTKVSTSQYGYDTYGNISSAQFPTDANNQHRSVTVVYDSQVHAYPASVSDESGYASSATYDYRTGQVLSTTDMAGQSMNYTYDIDGRLTSVRGPNEIASGAAYTLKFEYPAPNATVKNWAVTRHYNPGYPSNDIYTVQFCDGLGRPIQTKKTATVYNSSSGSDEEKTIVSGKVSYDAFGRADSAWYPTTEAYNLTTITSLSIAVDNQPPKVSHYDVMDRATQVRTPDQKNTYMQYGFGSDKYSQTRFSTRVTDANSKMSYVYKDARGLETTIKDALNGQTGFKYDALGQLSESSDPEGYQTTYQYDMLGQVTQRVHPDAGTTKYYYDNAGNLTRMQSQNLINGSDTIKYSYSYGRLMQISYPDNPAMNAYYQYGAANSGTQSGRLVKQQDASGVQTYEYGRMGEISANTHTYLLPGGKTYTMKMLWQYDSWNRVKQITYPDGEVVSYSYNQGGDLKQVAGNKANVNHPIVNAINYDKFGSRSRITYGNGTKAEYTYDTQSRRLSTLNSKNINNEAMQTLGYTYDNVGNITQISNSASAMANGLGGSYTCNYTYDNLYRLTSSTGNWGRTYNYSTGMSYSSSGRILSKTVNALTSINGTSGTITRNYSYTYNGTNKPHAARGAGTGTQMNYDGNGNMTSYSNPTVIGSTTRQQAWDEENRLGATGDGSYLTSYVYDAGGDRVLKLSGARQQMLVNNQYYINFANLNESKTLYVGGYMTVTDGGYTKHYYAESERVHSRLGGGFQYAPIAMNQVISQIYGESYAELALAMRHHLRMDVQTVGYDSTQTTFPNAFRSLDRLTGNNAETEKFFYHPDHLGSSSMITDKNGLACQHLQYLPFGEAFVEQRTTATYYTPYKFSAKEKDTETGYSYFGARYYDSDLSLWISTDPMSDQRPSHSPYNYCQWNPVKRYDPDGKTDYVLTPDGKIRQYGEKNDQPDRLGTMTPDGIIKYIVVNDKKILADLAQEKYKCKIPDADGNPIEEGFFRTSTTKNREDIVKLFCFVSKYSRVEWAICSTKDGDYSIGTFQFSCLSPSVIDMGHEIEKIKTLVHNHQPQKTEKDEIESLYGDRSIAQLYNFKYFVYFGVTRNLYKINNKTGGHTVIKNANTDTMNQILK